MKRMIDTEKFLDKLLYMGYMDEQKSEVEEVANRMTEEAYTKADVIAILEELNLEIDEMFAREINYTVYKIQDLIQSKINSLKENKNE